MAREKSDRVYLDSLSSNVSPLEFASTMALDEGSLSDSSVSDEDDLELSRRSDSVLLAALRRFHESNIL